MLYVRIVRCDELEESEGLLLEKLKNSERNVKRSGERYRNLVRA